MLKMFLAAVGVIPANRPTKAVASAIQIARRVNMSTLRIDEYYDANGELHGYACFGHLDSAAFRDQCEKLYAVRPNIVQHQWRKPVWIKGDPERKHSRGYAAQVSVPAYQRGARPVTIGLMKPLPRKSTQN